MGPADFLIHLLSFAAPALAVAALVALAARFLLPRGAGAPGWWASFAINSAAGIAVLAGGLWLGGRDGLMGTYAALVGVVATCQWLAGRGWRRG
ncbi:hypothetical protein FN976_21015 [Caenimonas sedimenti]|uniref:Uncharacterized protein n=1 Tax=Caenimonas sedimenti TaxID=2596921 RepID=A0A562ZKD1_9BURK|nr:hypothetical protein [Caenimonas sedimenti]TWO68881.1 hypothetical protein FN976_21015 [Caenimonas sedimenti]